MAASRAPHRPHGRRDGILLAPLRRHEVGWGALTVDAVADLRRVCYKGGVRPGGVEQGGMKKGGKGHATLLHPTLQHPTLQHPTLHHPTLLHPTQKESAALSDGARR